MSEHSPHELGRDAFTAYSKRVGGKNHQGEDIPEWDDLGPDIQGAWIEAAHAVKVKMMELYGPGN